MACNTPENSYFILRRLAVRLRAGTQTVKTMKPAREAFDYLVQVKAPKSFAEALDKAASDRLMSRSDFIRTTLADRLTSLGIEIAGAA